VNLSGLLLKEGVVLEQDLIRQLHLEIMSYIDPGLKHTLKKLGVRVECCIEANQAIQVRLKCPYTVHDLDQWSAELKGALNASIPNLTGPIHLEIELQSVARQTVQAPKHPRIANMIAVLSGKGGVGKSTVTTNLAVVLQRQGWRVGILDADVHGPSQLLMLGAQVDSSSEAVMEAHGLQLASMGAYLDPGQPAAWRGPMASKALQSLFQQTQWNELDYVLVDCPPGTSDIILSLASGLPVVAGLLVTTPQLAAVIDAERAGQLMKQLSMPILGVVENMSATHCAKCGTRQVMLGAGGGEALADHLGLECWAQLPLDPRVTSGGDQGMPVGLQDSMYDALGHHLTQRIALLKKYNPLSSVTAES